MSSGRLQEVKNNEKTIMPSPQKWSRSLTKGSYHRNLTGKNLVFWISSRLWYIWRFDCN